MEENEDVTMTNEGENLEPSKIEITSEDWELRLKNVKIRKEVMNSSWILLWLKDIKKLWRNSKRSLELSQAADVDLASITNRMAVVKAIECGNLEDATELNGLYPEIPEMNSLLIQQRMIELVRKDRIDAALAFAQNELKPFGEQNKTFLDELEKPIALLGFEDPYTCPVKELLDYSQRFKTASEVNKAIFKSQTGETGPKLEHLLKMLIWTQNQLDEKAEYPRMSDFSTVINPLE